MSSISRRFNRKQKKERNKKIHDAEGRFDRFLLKLMGMPPMKWFSRK